MRYWIWWNDLIQGPFELDELVSLRAFSADLPVCLEGREEWLPAGRIADLSAAVEQQKIARAEPIAPPPPAPNRAPAATPLQGEFFAEPPNQQSLLPSDDEPRGPYAYRPASGEPESPISYFLGQATMPFHFSQPPRSATAVVELPRPQVERIPVEKKSFFSRTAALKESPAREIKPTPEEKIERQPAVSLKILQDEPLEDVQETAEPLPAGRQALPSLTSPYEDQPVFGRKLELLPWIMGVALVIGLLVAGGYWLMDKVSNHSAITEANRLEPPAPISLPSSTPLPAPRVAIRDRMSFASVVHSSSPQPSKRFYISAIREKIQSAMAALKNVVGGAAGTPAAQAGQTATANTAASSGVTEPGFTGSPLVSRNGPGAAAPSGTAKSSNSSRNPAAAGSPGPATSGKASPVSSWLQKLSNPMALLKGVVAVAGGTAGAPAAQSGAYAGLAASGAGAAANVSGITRSVVSSGSSAPSAVSHSPGKTGIRMKPAPGRASHRIPHRKSKPERLHPSAKSATQVASRRPVSESAQSPAEAPREPAQALADAPVAEAKTEAAHLPGLSAAAPSPKVSPATSLLPDVPAVDAEAQAVPRHADPWAGRQSDAIKLVMAKTLPGGKITVGNQAKTLLMQMHEKELMHAAETGERLYLPDKMGWAALQEDGARYRVYLNFQAMQANGERVQARSYQFIVDLKSKAVRADDPATEQDLLTQNAELNFKHNPMAIDIDSILGGVDTYNKHKVQMIIIRKSRSNRDERTHIETALKAAQARILRAILYFRRTYPDKALQNVARAYNFTELVNGK